MNVSRRVLLGATPLAAAALLAGCVNGKFSPSAATVQVNLANAQAEAKTLDTAVTAMAQGSMTALSTSLQGIVSEGISVMGGAVQAFAALPSGSTSYEALAQNVIAAVQKVAALLPLPGATMLAINEGLALISALIAGLASIPVATPATVSARYGAKVVPGPISIPVS